MHENFFDVYLRLKNYKKCVRMSVEQSVIFFLILKLVTNFKGLIVVKLLRIWLAPLSFLGAASGV